MRDTLRKIVARKLDVTFEFNLLELVFKDLTVSKLPECHGQHDEGNPLDEIQSQHSHLFIKCRWFTVIVAHEETLIDVENKEGDCGDAVEGWQSAAIAESDANLKKNHGIAVMDKVTGAGVGVNIGLN